MLNRYPALWIPVGLGVMLLGGFVTWVFVSGFGDMDPKGEAPPAWLQAIGGFGLIIFAYVEARRASRAEARERQAEKRHVAACRDVAVLLQTRSRAALGSLTMLEDSRATAGRAYQAFQHDVRNLRRAVTILLERTTETGVMVLLLELDRAAEIAAAADPGAPPHTIARQVDSGLERVKDILERGFGSLPR